jgi:hypothetical protein
MALNNCVAIPGYGRAEKLAPRWYVGYLTYQGGNPRLKRSSLTGSGVIPAQQFISTFAPSPVSYATPVQSAVGSGTLVAAEPSLTQLLRQVAGGTGRQF